MTNETAERNTAARRAARRCYLTLLFADLSDSTKLAASMEAEEYATLVAELDSIYADVVPKHHGIIIRAQGDSILAIFGHPQPSEDDGRRATEAALDIHERVRNLRLNLRLRELTEVSVHSGIHSGLVLVKDGDAVKGIFELIGNAPNIAARLSQHARGDEILVSRETLGAESHFFHTRESVLTLQGAPEPVSVFHIVGRASINTRFEARTQRGLTPFVGRGAEMHVLRETLDETRAGLPRYVAVVAPAGVGKTRFVEEFLRHARQLDCQIHRGYCESYLSAEPLQPFLQMLRSMCGLDHTMSPALAAAALEKALSGLGPEVLMQRAELLRALSLSAPDPAGPRSEADRTSSALRDVFAALAATKPLVLFIDDWQWADDATRQVLGAIRSVAGRPIFILLATREIAAEDAGTADARVIELSPFNAHEAEESISRLLPGSDPFLVTRISTYSGGNPLFIEELCHSAASEGSGSRIRSVSTGAAWLNSLIESRVARLPAAQAELVRVAAVIGNVVPAWLLERITGYAENDPMVTGLAAEDLIFPGEKAGILRFKHGIARDVIYGSVGLHQRRALHLEIAKSLLDQDSAGGEEEHYETLAYHFAAGGQATDAVRYAQLAGDKAMAASALDRAQSQYRAALAALDLLEASDENCRRWSLIAQRLGLACIFDPARDQLPILERGINVAKSLNDEKALVSAEYWLGYINYGLGESRVAIHHLERALQSARHVADEQMTVLVLGTLGQARAAACDYDRALPLIDESLAMKRRHHSVARPGVGSAYSLACRAAVLGDRGQFAQAHACFDEALELLRGGNKVVEGSVLCWRSAVCLWQGRWSDALQSASEAQHIAERVKALYVYAMGRALGAYANWMIDRAPESLQTISDSTSWLVARDKELFISLNHGWLADGMVASGRYDEARGHTAHALCRTRKLDRLGEAMAFRAMARAAALGRARKPADHYLALAFAAAHARTSPHEIAVTQLCQAEIELARGECARAATLLDQAQPAFESMSMAWHAAEAGKLRESL